MVVTRKRQNDDAVYSLPGRANVINKSPEHAGLFARTRPLTLFDSAAGSLALKRARQDEIAGAGASTIKQQMTEKKPQAGEGRLA